MPFLPVNPFAAVAAAITTALAASTSSNNSAAEQTTEARLDGAIREIQWLKQIHAEREMRWREFTLLRELHHQQDMLPEDQWGGFDKWLHETVEGWDTAALRYYQYNVTLCDGPGEEAVGLGRWDVEWLGGLLEQYRMANGGVIKDTSVVGGDEEGSKGEGKAVEDRYEETALKDEAPSTHGTKLPCPPKPQRNAREH